MEHQFRYEIERDQNLTEKEKQEVLRNGAVVTGSVLETIAGWLADRL